MNLNSWLYLVVVLSASEAYKILVIFHVPGRSHNNLGDGLVRVLLDAGHEVTYFTSFPKEVSPPNLHQINISAPQAKYGFALESFLNKDETTSTIRYVSKITSDLSKKMVMHQNVQKFLNDTSQQFDVVIAEWLYSELVAGFSAIYDCPLIWLHPMSQYWLVLGLVDEYTNPAYTTCVLSHYAPPLNFLQRVYELVNQIYTKLCLDYLSHERENKAYNELIVPHIIKRGRAVPSFDQVRHNASLVLGNSHPSISQHIKLPPNYMQVGGYHIDSKNIPPLPQNLKKLIENSKNGVIYFSLGTNVKSKDIPQSIKQGILKVLGELKQTVLWKYEESMPNVPENVHILQWTPQQSILNHPNCILFITHGGLLSVTEAVHYAVPIIGIPVFADQYTNIEGAVKRGIGRKVELSYNMAEDLGVAINEVLRDTSYSERMKEVSMAYHHRPIPPSKELVHWVEHVVLTRGAPHLRSLALLVPWYQKMYLDLIVLIFVVIFLAYNALRRLTKNKNANTKIKTP